VAKKKPNGKGKPSRRRSPSKSDDLPAIPDPRTLEAMLRQVLGEVVPDTDPDSPLGRAQQILEEAYEDPSPLKRVELARQALAVCPDCADAYVLLGEYAAHRHEAVEMYEKAVAAAERALGPETFREGVGHFWGLLETRPYMRARQALAFTLWTSGRQEEAVAHARDMLRLNPGDNQGLRYRLAGWLLNLDRDDELAQLLEQYPEEESAVWAYTRALLAFRRHGDTPDTRQLLKEAKKVNKHVPDYILGKKRMPDEQPPYYSPGDSSEAVEYLAGSLAAWKNTAGAVDWLRAATESKRKKRTSAPAAQGPLPLVVERLKQLPQKGDVWQADCRELPMLVEDRGGQTRRPWLFLAVSLHNSHILAQEVTEEKPPSELLWDKLAQAMQEPFMGDPQRPAELQVRAGVGWEELRRPLDDLGIRCVTQEELPPIAEIVAHLAQSLGGEPEASLLDIAGVTPEQVGSFYESAAAFYQQAPWRRLGYENAVRIECDQIPGGPWYAVLMGQSGLTMGVALYDDLTLLERLWAGDLADEENAKLTVATSLTFGDSSEVALADVEAARRYGWKVARPDAYPSIFRKERGMSMRPPNARELELMEACLRALPDFVQRRRQDDTTPETIAVHLTAGERTMRLAWVRS
jgi:tetratricopeptide (TPR) repeat protein